VSESLTDRLQQTRLLVVDVDRERGILRVRGEGCSDLSCHSRTIVVTEDGREAGVDALYPGDIIRIETDADAAAARIVVLRRVWEGIASPET
jgi:hypothetical protein